MSQNTLIMMKGRPYSSKAKDMVKLFVLKSRFAGSSQKGDDIDDDADDFAESRSSRLREDDSGDDALKHNLNNET